MEMRSARCQYSNYPDQCTRNDSTQTSTDQATLLDVTSTKLQAAVRQVPCLGGTDIHQRKRNTASPSITRPLVPQIGASSDEFAILMKSSDANQRKKFRKKCTHSALLRLRRVPWVGRGLLGHTRKRREIRIQPAFTSSSRYESRESRRYKTASTRTTH